MGGCGGIYIGRDYWTYKNLTNMKTEGNMFTRMDKETDIFWSIMSVVMSPLTYWAIKHGIIRDAEMFFPYDILVVGALTLATQCLSFIKPFITKYDHHA
jgi:hypothetical protein